MKNHDKYRDQKMKNIEDHIRVLNEEMGSVQIDVAIVKTDVGWIKKTMFAIIPILAGMIITLIYIALKFK